MKVNFEFNFEELDNNELRINGRRTDFFSVKQWKSIIIKKEWISWIITTLRNLTYEDYNTWQRRIINDYEDCRLIIRIFLRENDYSFIKINPFWKDKNRITPAIEIPYLSWNKRLLMSEFIEPFLVALSQFLTEEERGKLPPPWSEREEEEKKKGKRKRKKDDQSDDGRISVRFTISGYGMRMMTYTRSNRRGVYWKTWKKSGKMLFLKEKRLKLI